MEVGKLIKDCRDVQGITQMALAKNLGFSEQFLGRIEKGKCKLPLSSAKKLSKALKINLMLLKSAFIEDYDLKIKKYF